MSNKLSKAFNKSTLSNFRSENERTPLVCIVATCFFNSFFVLKRENINNLQQSASDNLPTDAEYIAPSQPKSEEQEAAMEIPTEKPKTEQPEVVLTITTLLALIGKYYKKNLFEEHCFFSLKSNDTMLNSINGQSYPALNF